MNSTPYDTGMLSIVSFDTGHQEMMKAISSYEDLYSPKIKIIDDFGLGIEDTIVLLPDTTGMNNNDPILETGWYLKEGEEYIVVFMINGYEQKCFIRFLAVSNGKVMGNLTNWQEFLLKRFRISPRGMSVERFEKKVKKKLGKSKTSDG